MSDGRFEAATVEAALEQAAAELGVAVADLEHEVVEEKQDFWGGGEVSVVIQARLRAVAEQAAEPAPPATEPAAPATEPQPDLTEPERPGETTPPAPAPREITTTGAEDGDQPAESAAGKPSEAAAPEPVEVAQVPPADADRVEVPGDTGAEGETAPGVDPQAIVALLGQIFHDMEFACTIEIEAEGDGYLATIAGDDKEALLEGNGRGLSALELIVNNAFRHKLPRGSKVSVDAGDFRSRRDEELADLALQVAHSAKETGRTQETQPLNPYERRLVHLALADDAQVSTLSRGSGFLKNVQIIPEGGDRGGKERGRRG